MRFSMKKFARAFMALVLVFPISFCGGSTTPTNPNQGGPTPPTPPPPAETSITNVDISPASCSTIPFSQGSGARIGVSGQYTVSAADTAPIYTVSAFVSADGVHIAGGSTGPIYYATSGTFSSTPFLPADHNLSQTRFVIVQLNKFPQGMSGSRVTIKEVVTPWVFNFE